MQLSKALKLVHSLADRRRATAKEWAANLNRLRPAHQKILRRKLKLMKQEIEALDTLLRIL